MFHNLERRTHRPHHNGRPTYRGWSMEGNKWDVRWNGSAWAASELEWPFRSARKSTLASISDHIMRLPRIPARAEPHPASEEHTH